MSKNTWILPSFLAILYFFVAVFTLKDYGISWDETIHFSRGQAYLYYFLTGKTNYDDLPDVNLQGTLGKPENIPQPRRSFYQLTDFHNGDYYIYTDIGHPPINDIFAAFSNYIFYQKLGFLDDISAYHLFNIVASSLLVFIVVAFAQETLGTFAAVFSFIALCSYPLFWAESHFNIKDFPEAAFYAGTIWAFYLSLKKFSLKWLTVSIVLFSLGLGTKFNIFFVVPTLAIYLVYRYGKNVVGFILSWPRRYHILLLFAPFIVTGIFTLSWPLLWHNWAENILKVIAFYRTIGTEVQYQPQSFYIAGFNIYPTIWILFTTPPVTLILFAMGVIYAWIKRKEKSTVPILWVFWFIVPILRVTLPGSSIYGGVRQIAEFIPAMALLSGAGASWAWGLVKKNKIFYILFIFVVIGSYLLSVVNLSKLHPNENVYFNFLIGGLRGAQRINFPSWGNSYGNAYLQGIKWIDDNAPKGAKLSLIQGTKLNVPPILVRRDIDFSPLNWSGIERGGEYLMELTFNDTAREFNYAWEYVDKFLVPVYEVKVDGVAILKVWKNDVEHTRDELKQPEKDYLSYGRIQKSDNLLTVRFDEDIVLSRINLLYSSLSGCTPVKMSFLEISEDGKTWQREKDAIPYPQIGMKLNSQDGMITYYLAHKKARAVRFVLDDANSCALFNPQLNFKVF